MMKRSKHGFTLVELIIVIAVIGVLAAILIPVFANVIDKANRKSALSDARNTVSQYIMDAAEKQGMPHNITIFVKKASKMYVYGYNLDVSKELMMARGGEGYKGYATPADLMADYSFNEKHPGTVPDLTGATEYDEQADGSYWLVPYDPATGEPMYTEDSTGTVPIKGLHGTKASETYSINFADPANVGSDGYMTETMGEDVWVYHGYLLSGTYEVSDSNGGAGGGDEPTTTPEPPVTYTLTFEKGNTNGNDGKVTVPAPVSVTEGDIIIPASYSASYAKADGDTEWYVFDGWDQSGSITVTGDVTLTAQWRKQELVKHTLTFDADGGELNLASGVTNGMQIAENTDISSYVKGSSATKANHTFGGWDAGGGRIYKPDYAGTIIMSDDISLKAIWNENKYTVTINPNNGESTYELNAGGYSAGAEVILPAAPTAPTNKVFDYWKCSLNEIEYGAGGSYAMTAENVTFTAQWKDKYLVEFCNFDGTKIKEERIENGKTVTLPSSVEVKPENTDDVVYTFSGWQGTDGHTYAPGYVYVVTGDISFTAQFSTTNKFTITFAKGNTDGNDAKVTVPAPVKVIAGETFSPNSYTATYSEGEADGVEVWYIFDGWNPSGSFTVTGNATITATWVKYEATKYTLNFDPDGGTLNLASGVTDGMQIIKGKDVSSYITGSTASRDGYTFTGWSDGTNTYTPSYSGAIIMNGNISLTAVWKEIKYAVTIDNNNGDATYKLGDFAQGASVTLPEAPTKSGYVFDYWKTSKSGDNTEYGATGTYTMPNQDVTITAQWKDKYTVTFYDYTGAKSDERQVNADDTIVLPTSSTPAKPTEDLGDGAYIEYQFTGWLCSDGATYTGGASYTVTDDVTFTAQYLNVPKFTVSFSAGVLAGNSNVSGIPDSFTATPTTVVNPNEYGTPTFTYPGTGSDYVFDGWSPSSVVMAEESVTFTAQWTETPYYTVTFEANGGTMNLATLSGWANGGALRAGTDISSLVKNSTATKANAEFIGWECDGITYTSSSSTVPFTKNMTFTAQYNDIRYTVKYTAGEGTGSDYTQGTSYTPSQSITLATAATAGFTAPSGKVFGHWQSSIAGESAIEYGEGATYTVTANVTFTAIWIEDAGKTVTVKFYDTWNEETHEGGTIAASGTTVNFSQVESLAPTYWVQGATTTVTIDTDDTVTFNGDRHNTAVSGDAGTDYQVVTTLVGLKKVGNSSTTLTKNYWMLNDINNGGATWESLGWLNEGDTAFTGKFDGNGKSVTNFTANYSNTETTYIGLFAINDGTVRNLKIYMSSSIMGYQKVGSVAGQNNGTIEHCYVSSDDWSISAQNTTSSGGAAGGIAGYNAGTINDCVTAVCQVFAYNYAGGIAGYNNASGVITNCTTYGGVNEAYTNSAPYASIKLFYAGGIAGRNAGRIENCNVDLEPVDICGSKVVGGLVGQNDSTATLRNSNVLLNAQTVYGYCVVGGAVGYNNGGTISGVHVWFSSADAEVAASGSAAYTVGTSDSITGAYAGGLVGFTSGGTIELSGVGGPAGASIYSANTGDPSFYYWMVGGIAGANNGSTISQCWAYWPRLNRHTTATASGTIGCLQCVGGITGYNSGTVTNCFARNVEYTAYLYGAGLTGYNEGTVSYCWSYIKGYSTYNKTKSGDCVGLNDGGTLTSVYVYNRYNTSNTLGTSISGGPNSATALPSGFSTSVWELKSGFGPALIANPYAAVTIADGIMPEGM